MQGLRADLPAVPRSPACLPAVLPLLRVCCAQAGRRPPGRTFLRTTRSTRFPTAACISGERSSAGAWSAELRPSARAPCRNDGGPSSSLPACLRSHLSERRPDNWNTSVDFYFSWIESHMDAARAMGKARWALLHSLAAAAAPWARRSSLCAPPTDADPTAAPCPSSSLSPHACSPL